MVLAFTSTSMKAHQRGTDAKVTTDSLVADQAARSQVLFQLRQRGVQAKVDALFAWLLIVQWAVLMGCAVFAPAGAWLQGTFRSAGNVRVAVLIAGLIYTLPILFGFVHRGETTTRHLIAIAQLVTSALLAHMSGSVSETLFHIFGSLALLTF